MKARLRRILRAAGVVGLLRRLRAALDRLLIRLEGDDLLRRVGHDHVVWAYRLLLDREPESREVVQSTLQTCLTPRDLRLSLLSSPEFQARQAGRFAWANRSNVVIKELGGLRIFVDLADTAIGLNVLAGSYEPEELAFVRSSLGPGEVAVDAGANIGFFTLAMAERVGAEGRVYAFEPIAHNADLLERSLAENGFGGRVCLERAAVGDAPGRRQLITLDLERAMSSGGAYLRPAGQAVPPEHRAQEVEVVALDRYPMEGRVSFLKLDVEGAEPLALRGARGLLRRDRPRVLAEINPSRLREVSGIGPRQLIAELAELGYRCHRLAGAELGPRIRDVPGEDIVTAVFVPSP